MKRKFKMVYIEACIVQPAFYHDPPDKSLQCAQHKKDDKRRHHFSAEIFFDNEINEAGEEYDPNETCPKPVKPFPEKNGFKIAECEMTIQVFVLRNLLVSLECFMPLLFTERGYCAHNRIPFGYGKP